MILYKKVIIYIILFFINNFIIFAGGTIDYRWTRPREMKLRILNQTNEKLVVYLNTLHSSIIINSKENYDSGILLMDFNYNYPFFIGIEYPNNTNRIIYYAFKNPEKTDILSFYYYVIVTDPNEIINRLTGINIFTESEYYEFINDKHNNVKSLGGSSDGWSSFLSNDPGNPKNYLEILIINDTSNKKTVYYNDPKKELIIELDVNETRLIRIYNPIFLQGNQYEGIDRKFFSIKIENLDLIYQGEYKRILQMYDNIQIIRLRDTTLGETTIFDY